MAQDITPSLFQIIKSAMANHQDTVLVTKSTLIHISHSLEEMLLKYEISATLFIGFEQTEHWNAEVRRYRQLAALGLEIVVFVPRALPLELPANLRQIEIGEDHSLWNMWFILVLSPDFSAVMVAQDTQQPAKVENHRQFEVLLSFEEIALHAALQVVEPSKSPPPSHSKIRADVISALTLEVMHAESKLYEELSLTEELLTERHLAYQSLLHHARIVLLRVDQFGTVQALEGREARYFYPSPAAARGRNIYQLSHFPIQLVQFINRSLNGGDLVTELELQKKHFELRATLIYEEELVGVIVVGVNIEERHQQQLVERQNIELQRELKQQQELARLHNRVMTIIGHEFRTPLSVIMTSVDILNLYGDRLDSAKRQHRVEVVRGQIQHLTTMLEDVSLLLRGSIRLPLQVETLEIGQFCRGLVLPEAERVQMILPTEEILVEMDPQILQTLIFNLLDNALKYSTQPIQMSLRQTADQMVLVVADEGIGIPPEEINYVFEPFYRASNVDSYAGTGLGLAIVRSYLERAGGMIQLQSQEGQGTTVTVNLPLKWTRIS